MKARLREMLGTAAIVALIWNAYRPSKARERAPNPRAQSLIIPDGRQWIATLPNGDEQAMTSTELQYAIDTGTVINYREI